jgi:Domain of unknown function (DUF6457)
MNTLEEWTAAVRAGLGLGPGGLSTAEIKAVLDLARDAAHAVDRTAAPLTTYLLGVAVGRGLTLPDASARVQALAADWPGASEPGPGPAGGQEAHRPRRRPGALPDSYARRGRRAGVPAVP